MKILTIFLLTLFSSVSLANAIPIEAFRVTPCGLESTNRNCLWGQIAKRKSVTLVNFARTKFCNTETIDSIEYKEKPQKEGEFSSEEPEGPHKSTTLKVNNCVDGNYEYAISGIDFKNAIALKPKELSKEQIKSASANFKLDEVVKANPKVFESIPVSISKIVSYEDTFSLVTLSQILINKDLTSTVFFFSKKSKIPLSESCGAAPYKPIKVQDNIFVLTASASCMGDSYSYYELYLIKNYEVVKKFDPK